MNIIGSRKYLELKRKAELPINIPNSPKIIYAKNWLSWADFLGYDKVLTFEEAKLVARENQIKSIQQWMKYVRESKRKDLRSKPQNLFREDWKGWNDFLGKNEDEK